MSPVAARFIPRLLMVQLGVHLIATLIIIAFAPRVLLLDQETVDACFYAGASAAFAQAVAITLLTFVYARPIRRALNLLRTQSPGVTATDVTRIYAMPTRLVLTSAGAALVIAAFTYTPLSLFSTFDLYTHSAIIMFALTLGSAALVPSFVMMRNEARKVLELVPPDLAREATRKVSVMPLAPGRVRLRFLLAVVAPVAFVSIGSSLLVYAHNRAAVSASRELTAALVSRVAFEPIAGDDDLGRRSVMQALGDMGYRVALGPLEEGAPRVVHGDDGDAQVRTPVADKSVLLTFSAPPLSAMLWGYMFLTLLATAAAGLLGDRFGATFQADVMLATREIRTAGVAQVMQGTRIFGEARFRNVAELLSVVDALGSVFRSFAVTQVRATETREAAERMRGLFLAAMSHDLKGPLNAVLGFAELVHRSPLTPAQEESIAIIEQRGRELLMLIQTILDSARAEAGELDISPEYTMVGDVVMSAVLDTRELIAGSEVQIQAEIQPGIPKVRMDTTRGVQALTSIILTSARLADRGVVSVRATMPDEADRLRIEIESPANNLRTEERDKMFEAFKHVGSARKHGALGLGLSLARAIVEMHGGSIEVELSGGGGAVFRMWLPLRASRPSIDNS